MLSYQSISSFVACADAVAIVAAAIIAESAYHGFLLHSLPALNVPTGTGVIAAFIFLSLARAAELYRLPALLDPVQKLGKIVAAWAFALLILTAVLFAFKVGADLSRVSFFVFSAVELPLLIVTRLVLARIFDSMIANGAITGRAAIVIGSAADLDELSAEDLLHNFGLKEIDRVVLRLDTARIDAIDPHRAILEEAMARSRRSQALEFVLAMPWSESGVIGEISAVLRNSPLPVRLLPDRTIRGILDRHVAAVPEQTLSVLLQRAPMGWAERAAKRGFDIALAALTVTLLSPILIAAAVAIKLDTPGPVIFRQRRTGFNELEFLIFKFRTMQVLEDGVRIAQAQRNDPRVTRVGRILRRTSIDELPQLFNVLSGEMSLVGPRPHALAHDDQYKRLIESYCWRHHVKPGITGWAQVNGLRGETGRLESMERRIECDLWYINHWSLLLDLQILWQTCFAVVKHEAY